MYPFHLAKTATSGSKKHITTAHSLINHSRLSKLSLSIEIMSNIFAFYTEDLDFHTQNKFEMIDFDLINSLTIHIFLSLVSFSGRIQV